MKIYVNDRANNLLAVVKTKNVPRKGESLFLKSVNHVFIVDEIYHQFTEDNDFECITLYVTPEAPIEEDTSKFEMPEWVQRMV